jgi:tetratricopeptide (TPR) repeat protein
VNSYFTYYLAWIFLSYALRTPWLLLGVVVLLVLRRFIPGPGPLLRLFGRARSLRGQVEVNRANITARRDLAVIYLDGMRARAAIPLLQEGLALSPNDPELLYLSGLALHRVGRHEEALPALVRAVELDPRVRYGLPYAVAGDALAALKRWDGALDAYERYLADNSSDVSAYTRLARAHARTSDRKAASETLHEGLRTWGVLPGSMKRRQFGSYLAAHWARVIVLGEPSAIALLFALTALFALGVHYTYGPVVRAFSRTTSAYGGFSGYYPSALEQHAAMTPELRRLYEGFERCGTQSTGDFAGRYAVLPESFRAGEPRDQYASFEIAKDRIVSGKGLIQEFCLTRVIERSPTLLHSEAVWHEDINDPGDAAMVLLTLSREGDVTTLRMKLFGEPERDTPFELKLKRE